MTTDTEYITISKFSVKVDGTEISDTLRDQLREITIDNNLLLPDMFTLQYDIVMKEDQEKQSGEKKEWLKGGPFQLGKLVELIVDGTTLIKAEVTALEPEFSEGGHILFTVRGYDKSHHLYRGKKTRVFAEMTDSDIVSQVISDAGLSADADGTSYVHPHVWQNNQTDMEFIKERARRVGYYVYFEDEKLCFKKKAEKSGTPTELQWGSNLRSFQPRFAVTHQADKTKVSAWDPAQKKRVESNSTGVTNYDPGHQGGESSDGGAVAKKALSDSSEAVIVNYPQLDADQAQTIAAALYDKISSGFVRAEGICIGNPKVKSGTVVKITGVGEAFEGTYVVTSAIHSLPQEGNAYETFFTIRGQQSDVLDYLLEGEEITKRSLYPGVVPAIVTDNSDPDDVGRVKVKFPWLDDELESDWARLAAIGAGATRGMYYIPEIDDEVLVAFEYGDMSRPYIMGGLWHQKDTPPLPTSEAVADGIVNKRIIQSRTGHIVLLDDTDGEENVTVTTQGEHKLVMHDAEKKVEITTTGGHTALLDDENKKIEIKTSGGHTTLMDDQGKKIQIKTSGGHEITMDDNGTKLTIKGQVNIEVTAQGNIDLKATGQLNIQGAQVSIKSDAMTSVESSGMTQVKGSIVKIN